MDPRIDHSPTWFRLGVVTAVFGAAIAASAVTLALALVEAPGTVLGVSASMALYVALIAYLAVAEAATMWRRRRHLNRPQRTDPVDTGAASSN